MHVSMCVCVNEFLCVFCVCVCVCMCMIDGERGENKEKRGERREDRKLA